MKENNRYSLTDQEKEIIVNLWNNAMSIATTARVMNYNRNTIVWHMNKIKKRTGLDPRNCNDLMELRMSMVPKATCNSCAELGRCAIYDNFNIEYCSDWRKA